MPAPGVRPDPTDLMLRMVVAAGLGVDAYVHVHLAHGYQLAAPGGIGGGTLFRLEAAAAVVAGLFVLALGTRAAFAAAAAVGLLGVVAVVLYRYVDVPALGPFPSMYEPIWYAEKTASAVAEGLTALVATVGALRRTAPRVPGVRSPFPSP
jgi:hypothetical protein